MLRLLYSPFLLSMIASALLIPVVMRFARALGYSPRRTVLIIMTMTAWLSGCALLSRQSPWAAGVLALAPAIPLVLFEKRYVARIRAGHFSSAVVYVAGRRVIESGRLVLENSTSPVSTSVSIPELALMDTGCIPVSLPVSSTTERERAAG